MLLYLYTELFILRNICSLKMVTAIQLKKLMQVDITFDYFQIVLQFKPITARN